MLLRNPVANINTFDNEKLGCQIVLLLFCCRCIRKTINKQEAPPRLSVYCFKLIDLIKKLCIFYVKFLLTKN